ncbi:MAG: prefoldin subunit alpha [Candidatus Bilamarchaeaceae archaeon]
MDGLEQEYARLSYEARVYKNQLALLQKEIEKVTLTSMDINNAVRTLESMAVGEALIPIGGGSFARGEVKSTSILLSVGGGYLIEVSKETALEKLKRRAELTKQAIERLAQEFSKISARLDATAKQLRETERRIVISKRTEESAKEDYI